MKTTRRDVLKSLALLPLSIATANAADLKEAEQDTSSLVGSWHTTSATTSIIFSIETGGGVLGMFIENGSYSIWRSRWKSLPGGVLIQGTLRFRLWEGRHTGELRAEMEKLPEEIEVSKGFSEFPLSFFMRRVEARDVPKQLLERPLPEEWATKTPDKEWDENAGKRRTATK